MTSTNPKCIEEPIRFSHSKLWEIQKNYFKSMGIQAWDEQVPFYITSNMFIANRYATLLIQGILDLIDNHPNLRQEKFYFLEIGSGTGKFSFYFLKAFEKLLKIYSLEDLKYCYIVSDVVEANVSYCKENPSFLPFIEAGKVDFSIFNVVEDTALFLMNQKVDYASLQSKTPMMVIANYVLDCIKVDLFKCNQKEIEEVQVGLNSRYKDFNIAESRHLEDIKMFFETEKIDPASYYQNPILNQCLTNFQKMAGETSYYFPIPVGAFEFVEHLSSLTNHHFILIVGDRGISNSADIPMIDLKNILAFNGCFSFLVNFVALKEYFCAQKGDALLSTNGPQFNVNVFTQSLLMSQLPKLSSYYSCELERMGPKEYCDLYSVYDVHDYRFDLMALLSFLKISEYDPDCFSIIFERLHELESLFTPIISREFDMAVEMTHQNVYHCPIGQDVMNMMGRYYAFRKNYSKAIEMFKQSISIFNTKSLAYRNLAIIYDLQKDKTHALEYFKEAYEQDKNDAFVKRKMLVLEGKPTYAWVFSVLKALLVFGSLALVIFLLSK